MFDIDFKYQEVERNIHFCYRRDDESEVEGILKIKEYSDGTQDKDIEYLNGDKLSPEELELLLERQVSDMFVRVMNLRTRNIKIKGGML